MEGLKREAFCTKCGSLHLCAHLCLTFCDPMVCNLPQAPLSTGLSFQEYLSGLPFPPLGDLPIPGMEPMSLEASPLTGRLFTTEPLTKPLV